MDAADSNDMVVAEELVKDFPRPDGRETRAVDHLSFRVPKGTIYGLLGPNGAGKTTTLRILSGLMAPTGGVARLAGFDVATEPREVKRILGFLTANTGLYQRLSARELLVYFARLHQMDRPAAEARVDQLIDWLGIASVADLRCGALSTGQKQRVNIGRALVADLEERVRERGGHTVMLGTDDERGETSLAGIDLFRTRSNTSGSSRTPAAIRTSSIRRSATLSLE